jgi:hypothetical protein
MKRNLTFKIWGISFLMSLFFMSGTIIQAAIPVFESNAQVTSFTTKTALLQEPYFYAQADIIRIDDCCATIQVRVYLADGDQHYLVYSGTFRVNLFDGDCCASQGFDPLVDAEIYDAYTSNQSVQVAVDQAINQLLNHQGKTRLEPTTENCNQIVPNPVFDALQIQLCDVPAPWVKFFIYDANGRMKMSSGNQPAVNGTLKIKFPQPLPAGVYFIELHVNGKREVLKFVVETPR